MTRTAIGRRAFIGLGGASIAGVVVAGCGDDNGGDVAVDEQTDTQPAQQGDAVVIDFAGTPDLAVVNFAFALEQLEATFYDKVNNQPPKGFNSREEAALQDIGAHETAHAEFFRAKLGKKAIPDLQFDFSNVDFSDRQAVLETAQTFEDLGVWAYNGAAQFIGLGGPLGIDPLQAAGEIVSVEARHASIIRTLLGEGNSGDFAPDAFDKALTPPEVLEQAKGFFATPVQLKNVPQPKTT